MVANHASLLRQLRDYVDEHVTYLGKTEHRAGDEANADLRRIIAELEELLAHPDQQAEAARLQARIENQLAHLRSINTRTAAKRPAPSRPQQTLVPAFQSYINEEVAYLLRVSGGAHREQTNLLLSDIVGDLKALALRPNEKQSEQLAADLDRKCEQVRKLQRPWQRTR